MMTLIYPISQFLLNLFPVKEAVKLNRDLMYTNEHQKCIIEQHKREITLLNSQILDTKVKVESKPLDYSRIEQEQELSNLKQQLENVRNSKIIILLLQYNTYK